ncbi:MAG TPA: hypothetical protein LFV91_02955 [Rickettsia endosymbiont of Bembidion nr. Transversale]|nr:hypothetical protein [Rickettsia endosymbiont of Bembidion nr. Transversale]
MGITCAQMKALLYWVTFLCHPVVALLRGSDVMPWLDHGIQKIIKNTNFISILSWIPLQARGMTGGE